MSETLQWTVRPVPIRPRIDSPWGRRRNFPARSYIWPILISATLGACVTASQQLREPQILSGSDTGVAIVSAPDMRPKPLAQAHCAQYQKQAVLRDVDRIGESVATRWGNRAYVVHFDCM